MTVEDERQTPDETSPLLDSANPPTTVDNTDDDKPLNMVQIILLCYASLGEGVAFIYIFPFINAMIYELGGVPETDVGFWAGLIESLYSCTQTLVMIAWGKVADRYGRKPVLASCSAGVCLSIALFGASKSLWQMILFRCMAGVFAGSYVTVRTMVSESSTPRTSAHAFAIFQFFNNVGLSVGPMLGGVLSHPVELFPSIFGGSVLFAKYPYLLPCVVCALIPGSASLLLTFFVKETLPPAKDTDEQIEAPSMREILKAPGVLMVLAIFQLAWIIANAYAVVLTIFLYTPVELGGLNLSPTAISIWMTIMGIGQAFWILVVFPPLQHRFGTGNALRLGGWFRVSMFIAYPLLNIFARMGNTWAFWILAPWCTGIATGVNMVFTSIQLALNDISPSPLALNSLNAIAMSLNFGLRAFIPALFGSLFAVSVRYQLLGGHLVWAILLVIGLAFMVLCYFLPEKAEGRKHRATVLGE